MDEESFCEGVGLVICDGWDGTRDGGDAGAGTPARFVDCFTRNIP